MSGAQSAMIGKRLHLQHGPIDLIILAEGEIDEVHSAYEQARAAFDGVLEGLVADLPLLRRDVREFGKDFAVEGIDVIGVSSPVAERMVRAVSRHDGFVTPMAAVAGSVADHILAAMRDGLQLSKAMVNNGGDIALWQGEGAAVTVGVGDAHERGVVVQPVTLTAADRVGGVATSGWRGRSHSLGIADFVTVFAPDAAAADVAATLIANAVDLPGSPKVTRQAACELSPDSDLGARLVTVSVAPLSRSEVGEALSAGVALAERMADRGSIKGAMLGLQGCTRTIGGGALPGLSLCTCHPSILQEAGAEV